MHTERMARIGLVTAGCILAGCSYGIKYSLTDLGINDRPSSAEGLNNHGDVVGAGHIDPHRWQSFAIINGHYTDLGLPFEADNSAVRINDSGQVVGWIARHANTQVGYLYSGGKLTYLEGSRSADGINSYGEVVGTTVGSRAYLYSHDTMHDLGTLGGKFAYAEGINDRSQVVGSSITDKEAYHACMWAAGTVTDLGAIEEYSSAIDINNNGQIVGTSDMKYVFLYENGAMTVVASGMALGINESGQIIGIDNGRPFLYTKGVVFYVNDQLDQTGLGYHVEYVTDISDTGQMAGYATRAGWGTRAVLLTPCAVPEPGTIVALGAGVAVLIRGRKRRG